MRNRVAIAAFAVILIIALLATLQARTGSGSTDVRPSSFLYGANGAAALYALLQELDLPVERQLVSWSDGLTEETRAIAVLAPSSLPSAAERSELAEWVDAGGTLVFAVDPFHVMAASLGLQVRSLQPDTLGSLATVRWRGVAAFPEAHAWTAGIDSISGFRSAFFADSRALTRNSATVLMRTGDGEPTVVTFRRGAGRIIAWSDASVLGNRALGEGGGALLFTRIAEASTEESPLLFDEYHHGFREASPMRAIARALVGTGAGRSVMQAAAACLMILLLYAARFGEPIREHPERRRSSLEHVQALATAYERADARRTARRMLLAGLERRLGRRVFMPDGAVQPALLGATASGRRLKTELENQSADLGRLATAIDEYIMEVRRWK